MFPTSCSDIFGFARVLPDSVSPSSRFVSCSIISDIFRLSYSEISDVSVFFPTRFVFHHFRMFASSCLTFSDVAVLFSIRYDSFHVPSFSDVPSFMFGLSWSSPSSSRFASYSIMSGKNPFWPAAMSLDPRSLSLETETQQYVLLELQSLLTECLKQTPACCSDSSYG